MTFLELHPLTAAELSAVVKLDELCFGGLWTRSGYERELDSPSSQLLVLEARRETKESGFPIVSSESFTQNSLKAEIEADPTSQKSLLGLGCYWSILEEAHITILAVHPNYQRQGLGQLMLYALLRDAKKRQLEWATLEVKPSNQAALSLYHKFGFTEAGRRRRYYKDTGEDALILWRGGLQAQEFEETLTHCYQQVERQLTLGDWQLWTDEAIEEAS
ncbi:MAG: ribosomal protein S18-alanine N-acetyltransferase [Symplocastrum torsivum CPER-KK1]|uniref:Ribosomal protein S18-alanine N-acetyltransferase n=1 Tax=Symplocastrum torsivum CPER-KK1 TaxID=450513 RepID=A0A951UBV4_9CYAN|nr:ribosomal protein S18-alanine N-acetyltransferase [Symplocastrum torsivum CPER-KK1]